MEDVGTFHGHLVCFKAIWHSLLILWLLGIFFIRFGVLYQEKSGNFREEEILNAVARYIFILVFGPL
jgi:hypothetical protein